MTKESITSKEQQAMLSVEELPVLTNLCAQAKFSLTVMSNGHIYLFHENKFREPLNWVEYDAEMNRMFLVTIKGRLQELGIKADKDIVEYITKSNYIYVVRIQDGREVTVLQMPLLIQDYKI